MCFLQILFVNEHEKEIICIVKHEITMVEDDAPNTA